MWNEIVSALVRMGRLVRSLGLVRAVITDEWCEAADTVKYYEIVNPALLAEARAYVIDMFAN